MQREGMKNEKCTFWKHWLMGIYMISVYCIYMISVYYIYNFNDITAYYI